MRRFFFDQFEFDHPDSEVSLELWMAARSRFPYPDLRSFVASTATVEVANALRPAQPFPEPGYGGMVRAYLARFAGVSVPTPCDWLTYELINDACDWDAAFEAPGLFIRFHWWSTA